MLILSFACLVTKRITTSFCYKDLNFIVLLKINLYRVRLTVLYFYSVFKRVWNLNSDINTIFLKTELTIK